MRLGNRTRKVEVLSITQVQRGGVEAVLGVGAGIGIGVGTTESVIIVPKETENVDVADQGHRLPRPQTRHHLRRHRLLATQKHRMQRVLKM